jgi:hypothetical protein
MIKIIVSVCFLILFLFYIYITFIKKRSIENFENINENIGNYLSDYYYKLFLSILNEEDFKYEKSQSIFLNKLPIFIPYEKNRNIRDKIVEKNIKYSDYENYESISFWEFKNKNSEIIHSIMKPIMHNIIKDALLSSGLKQEPNNIIIHFRCADTPFLKSHHYHFQKYKYFKDALSQFDNINVIILTNNKHNSTKEQQASCDNYTSKLSDYIKSIGYNVITESGTNIDDFSKMFFSEGVISTGSSFSFMAGYFGNGKYIQPTVTDINNIEQCMDCADFIYKGYNINHIDIKDYNNIEEVYKLLVK